MADIVDVKQGFFEYLSSLFKEVECSRLLFSLREKAWNAFLTQGLPEKIDYFPVSTLYAKRALFASATDVRMPSQEGMEILPLEEALQVYGASLKTLIMHAVGQEKDPFALLNRALHRRGFFMYVPPNTSVQAPLECADLPCVYITVGAHAHIDIVVSARTEGHTLWDLALGEGASVRMTFLDMPSKEAHILSSIRARLKKNSSFQCTQVSKASEIMRRDYRIVLEEEGASAELHGMSCAGGRTSSHVNVFMEHKAQACHSMQNFKGLVADHAHISCEGKIYVHPEAQKTQAYQINRNFLLSQGARAYAKPNLEIFADDVKASHGATMAKWDETQLLYLQSRGIDCFFAKQLILKGFFQDVIGRLGCPYTRREAECLIKEII